MVDMKDPIRDLVGYGRNRPAAHWPNNAQVALQFVINYEEGAERSVLNGDQMSETALMEEPLPAISNLRNLFAESQNEYGSRVGFWRLHRMFTERNLPVTVFGVAAALKQNLEAVAAMKEAQWEVASHGLRWINYAEMPFEEERQQVREAIRIHEKVMGAKPAGWYTGRLSPNTRRIVHEEGDFVYDSDSFADDLPYWVESGDKDLLVVPYSLDNNDGRFLSPYGFGGVDFAEYLRRSLDFLRSENNCNGSMMSVGLHCRVSGRPGRAASLARFLDYVAELDDVWITTRVEIANHWHREHRPDQKEG